MLKLLYPATVTLDGKTVNIRVGQASVSDVRRAICRQMGWPSSEGKMVQLDDTLQLFRVPGITKFKIIGDAETLDVQLEKDGRCKSLPDDHKQQSRMASLPTHPAR